MNNLGGEKGILGQRRAGAGCAVHASKALNSDQAVMKPFPRQWLAAGRTLGFLSVTSFLEQMRQMKVTETVHALVPAKKKKKKTSKADQRAQTTTHLSTEYIPPFIFAGSNGVFIVVTMRELTRRIHALI